MTQRVVVTGMAGLCPLGLDWESVREGLLSGRSGVAIEPSYYEIAGLTTQLAAPVRDFISVTSAASGESAGMGRVSQLALNSAQSALNQAGLLNDPILMTQRVGLAYGSTTGSPPAIENFGCAVGLNFSLEALQTLDFKRLLSHTCALNLAQYFHIGGTVLPTSSACTSGSQAIGFSYERIKWGLQDVMIAGGAEELHVICTAVFDVMRATSTRHEMPSRTPRPFDVSRDGLVVGEGAATLILESLEHARKRGAVILAEVVGFASNANGSHVVNPSPEEMARVQMDALRDAGLASESIDYVCAHATATEVGDIAETIGTASVFGPSARISSLKGHMGHTLGACGSIEAWAGIHMMNEGWLAPTLNLDQLDPRCAPLDYLTQAQEHQIDHFMTNNFAFGGVNSSLIFKHWR